MMNPMTALILALTVPAGLMAEPQLSSWNISGSGHYARLFETTADESALNSVTTWSRGAGVQNTPTYAGVHEVAYSDGWVYIRTTGLGQHIMGPWYRDGGAPFPNYPSNTATRYRIPRAPQDPPASAALTGLGPVGYFVDGVAMFDSRDAFSYSNNNATDATPGNGITGDDIWNRDAYVNEGITFDAGGAHQAGNRYHYHANPPALRHRLGGNVDYDEVSNTYSESTNAPAHSPLLGWVADGHPIYGPYGYSDATNSASAIRLMTSGYRTRTLSTRQVLPAWAARVQGYTTSGNTSTYTLSAGNHGPAVDATYPAGHYIEDYEYLGDLGFVQGIDFDLDEHNGRFCATPEFPGGVYAYFTSIETNGTPRYPYNIGRSFYGDPTGDNVTTVAETLALYAEGGPEKIARATIGFDGNDVVLMYDGVEGGHYRIECATNLVSGTPQQLASNLVATAEDSVYVHTNGQQNSGFYKIMIDSVAAFDDTGYDHSIPVSGNGGSESGPVVPSVGNRGTTVNLTITLDADAGPPLPPVNAPINNVTVGSWTATSPVRVNTTTITATLVIPAGASTGSQDVVVTFNIPSYTLLNAFTIL